MRFGAITHVWKFPLDATLGLSLIERCARLGADHVELSAELAEPVDRRVLRNAIERAGLTVSLGGITGPDRDPSSLDEDVRVEGARYARWCIDLAGDVGARVVGAPFCGTGSHSRMSGDERLERLAWGAEGLHEAGAYAQSAGVLLAVEPLNRFENNLLNTGAQVRELVVAIDHPGVAMMLDTFHMNIEEDDIGQAVRDAGPLLAHLQVADNHRGTPGTGSLDWIALREALDAVGYDGAVVIETVNPDDPIAAPLASMWRHLAPDMDTLVAEGISFLRRTLPSDRGG